MRSCYQNRASGLHYLLFLQLIIGKRTQTSKSIVSFLIPVYGRPHNILLLYYIIFILYYIYIYIYIVFNFSIRNQGVFQTDKYLYEYHNKQIYGKM